MASRVIPLLLTLFLIAASGAHSARADACPEPVLTCGASTVSSAESAGTRGCPILPPDYGSGSLGFDSAAARFELSFMMEFVVLDAVDRFVPGVPVAITAVLDVTGRACGGDVAHLIATLQQGSGSAQTQYSAPIPGYGTPCPGAELRTISVPISAVAGNEFDVRVRLHSDPSSGDGNATAFLRFTGLPPGARIRSCKGYAVDVPVPATSATWGWIKGAYR